MKPLFLLALSAPLCLTGCASLNAKSQSPDDEKPEASTRLVGDVAVAFGREAIQVEGVGLIVDLAPGQGSDPPPSIYRAMMLDDMRKRGVVDAESILARNDTAVVIVRGLLRPGVQEGDHFDLELRVPNRSETKSLRGGRLMRCRLSPNAVVGGAVREGRLLALGEGPVLTDPAATDDPGGDPGGLTRGRVLGGGVALKSHSLGLLLKPDYQKVHFSAAVGHAVNRRFHMYRRGLKENVAKPINDEFIELKVHPRYTENIPRYLRVARSLPLRESDTERVARMELLSRQLLDPLTSSNAALRLEAIGHESVEALLAGVESEDTEVRFYAAEALAYLDHEKSSAAAEPLAQAAESEPAFRVFALTALSSMNDGEAYHQLRRLLGARSVETRYGAFRALWAMNENDPLVRGEQLGGQFSYHALAVEGPPMIHLTSSFRPEIVLFGDDLKFLTPLVLEAGPEILINGAKDGTVTVSRFAPNQPDQQRQVSPRVDDVIRAAVELGGKYPDVAQMLQQANDSASLAGDCRLAVDAVPQSGRTYRREEDDSLEEDADDSPFVVANPLPNLFPQSKPKKPRKKPLPAKEEEKGYFSGFFDRFWPGQ